MVNLSRYLGFAWVGDFDSLKTFIKESLQIDGVWTQPGSDQKVFTADDLSILWRKNKGTLHIDGTNAMDIKKAIFGMMDESTVNSADEKNYSDVIEDLRTGQQVNAEAISALSNSLLHYNSIISQFQNFMAKGEQLFDKVESNFKLNSPYNVNDVQKCDDLVISPTELDVSNVEIITGNNHQISKKEVPTQVMESDVVLLDKSQQASEVSDTPMITKRPETYTEALLSNLDNVGSTHSDEFGTRDENNNQKGGVTNHCMEKEGIADSVKESHSQPPSYSDVGFKGVDRRRNRIKHFFLSGISEDVSESQIKSYLSKRNVIPKYISVFQSRRRGSISAKVSVPSSAIPLLQDENFWPEHVKCKPWRKNPMKNATYV